MIGKSALALVALLLAASRQVGDHANPIADLPVHYHHMMQWPAALACWVQ
jgi:hypothetical protein